MKVREMMTTDVIGIAPDAPLKKAAIRMMAADISGLVVVDDDGALVGVISEGDFIKTEAGRHANKRARLLKWLVPDEAFPDSDRKVSDIMTNDVITVTADADHVEAARIMGHAGVKRLPVVDEDGDLVGLVSRSDIVRAFARLDTDIVNEIRDRIMRKVLWIDAKRVEIVCQDGNVSLSGELETKSDAELLVSLTERLVGVVSVHDHLSWEIDNTTVEMIPPVPAPPYW